MTRKSIIETKTFADGDVIYSHNDLSDFIYLSKFINMAALNNDIYEINSNNKFIYKLDEKDSNIRRKNVNLLLDELL